MFDRELRRKIEKLQKLGFKVDYLFSNQESYDWWKSSFRDLSEESRNEIEKRIEELKREVMEI